MRKLIEDIMQNKSTERPSAVECQAKPMPDLAMIANLGSEKKKCALRRLQRSRSYRVETKLMFMKLWGTRST